MDELTIKGIYREDDQKVLEIDVLPERYCNFNCIFCPIERTDNQTDEIQPLAWTEGMLEALEDTLESRSIDLVFINPAGEGLVHPALEEIIRRIHSKGCKVRLLSNGYLFNDDRYRHIANTCDEVICEIKTVTETDFKKMQRPLPGYTLEAHFSGMAAFNRQYPGSFILEITMIKNHNDSEASIEELERLIRLIRPDRLEVVTLGAPFDKKLGISQEELDALTHRFQRVLDAM